MWLVCWAGLGFACSTAGEGTAAPPRAPPAKAASAPPPAKVAAAVAPVAAAAPEAPAQRGQRLYAQMCAVCHGAVGEGYKADQATALAQPDFLASASDAFLRHAIVNGRKDTTMSAWALERGGPLSRADVAGLIAFVRTWEKQPRAVLDQRAPSGDPRRGEQTYARECARCHGARGTGGPNVRIADPELWRTAGVGFMRHAIHTGRPGTSMPAYADKLGNRGVEDVLAYLARLQPAQPPPPPKPSQAPPIPLGRVPLNPKGPEPVGFNLFPGVTSVDVVHAQLARGARMALLDARAPSDYANEHIAGAVSVPFYDPTPYLGRLPKNAWLVSYCACPHAESKTLAEKLVAAGFPKVTVLNEGLGVWKARKYPVRTGPKP